MGFGFVVMIREGVDKLLEAKGYEESNVQI